MHQITIHVSVDRIWAQSILWYLQLLWINLQFVYPIRIHSDSSDILHPLDVRVTKHKILSATKTEGPNFNIIQPGFDSQATHAIHVINVVLTH